MNKITLGVSVVIAVFVVLWYSGILNLVPQVPTTLNDVSGSGSVAGTIPEGSDLGFAILAPNAIYVAEQWPGKELVINIVGIELPGYVVVHESKDGKPGAIIGNSDIIRSGGGENVKVVLKRAVKDGEELIAMLHNEKVGTGFDPAIDLPVVADGSAIHMIFQVSAEAPDPSAVEVRF